MFCFFQTKHFLHFSHFNTLNLVQMSKTVQVLLTQIQEHIYEYNFGKSSTTDSVMTGKMTTTSVSSSESEPCEWNFPGLRKTSAPVYETRADSGNRAEEEKGVGEILLLQQRTVLQVSV